MFAPVWLNLGVTTELIIAVANLGTWVRSVPGVHFLVPGLFYGWSLSDLREFSELLWVLYKWSSCRLWIISVCSLCCSLCVFGLFCINLECAQNTLWVHFEWSLEGQWICSERSLSNHWIILLWVSSLQRVVSESVCVPPITTNLGVISECALGYPWVFSVCTLRYLAVISD